jgi:hypothetical protein
MNVEAARAVLGVSADDDWAAVRTAFRERIRTAHPDLVGPVGTDRAVQINAAYRVLALARREGRLDVVAPDPAAPPPSPPPRRPRHGAPGDVRLVGGDTIVLSSTPDETFRRLVEATHALGEISYIDRSAAMFEAVLQLQDGKHASFVVSLQWRAHDATCEAFCTLEALDRAEHLDAGGVLEQLVEFIPPLAEA